MADATPDKAVALILLDLARQVRQRTIELLALAHPPWLTWAPAGTSNHLLWHAGHAVWLQDVLCVKLLTGESELPDGWETTFGQHGRPPNETTQWPDRSEVLLALGQQLDRLSHLLYSADLSDPTRYSRIIHGLHDEARHQGEMYLLLKLCRAGRM